MRRWFALVLLLLVSSAAAMRSAPKLTAEQLVKLHLEAVGTPAMASGATPARDVRGVCSTTSPARAAGELGGTFRLLSSPASARLAIEFNTDLYEGELFAVEGQQVEIGFAQRKTSSRSALGNFIAVNRVIVAEGLLGGVLNARWPLLDVAGRQPKLTYEGVKKLAGRELHSLRYRAKEKQGDLEIRLYFDPETYQHAASVYETTKAQGLGLTPETSSQEADLHFRMEERFAGFQKVAGTALPRRWLVRYERTGNTANEWKYDMTVETVDEVAMPGGKAGAATD